MSVPLTASTDFRPIRRGARSCVECKFAWACTLSSTFIMCLVFCSSCLLLASHETMSTKPNQSTGRRRKVRCNYSPENPVICKRCFKYNLECVDPSQQISDAGREDRKTLRERVSRLEERLDAVQKGDLPTNVAGNQATPKRGFLEDDETDLDATSPMAPLIAVLQGSNVGPTSPLSRCNLRIFWQWFELLRSPSTILTESISCYRFRTDRMFSPFIRHLSLVALTTTRLSLGRTVRLYRHVMHFGVPFPP